MWSSRLNPRIIYHGMYACMYVTRGSLLYMPEANQNFWNNPGAMAEKGPSISTVWIIMVSLSALTRPAQARLGVCIGFSV